MEKADIRIILERMTMILISDIVILSKMLSSGKEKCKLDIIKNKLFSHICICNTRYQCKSLFSFTKKPFAKSVIGSLVTLDKSIF